MSGNEFPGESHSSGNPQQTKAASTAEKRTNVNEWKSGFALFPLVHPPPCSHKGTSYGMNAKT
ncbi:hypothetical protein NECAME_05754 [Necator americanus]|uniref:Uncharacterized protein n=1 Tax=Necator americanus TaxID=51031 RepID=W2TZ14_NECAM|nr:hypothetical protein NECAME_05754 [Necator americanus]ETN86909.1 hypothetical protein NECAME_05754 [Necator americanus]